MKDLMRSQRETSTSFFLNKTLILFGIAGMALVAAGLGGCDGATEGQVEASLSFTGTVIDFKAESLLEFESITVANESGVVLDFHSEGKRFEEFTPAHVREHMVLGDPVEVGYREVGDRLLIVSLQDLYDDEPPAPSGSP